MNNINKEVKLHYKDAVHFLPLFPISRNVRCLNGSAHLHVTEDINKVTCELCKNPNTNKEFFDLQIVKKRRI